MASSTSLMTLATSSSLKDYYLIIVLNSSPPLMTLKYKLEKKFFEMDQWLQNSKQMIILLHISKE
jgi:hypothetical protein